MYRYDTKDNMPLYVNRQWKRREKYSSSCWVNSFKRMYLKKNWKRTTGIFFTQDTAFRFSHLVVSQIKRINDQRHVSWRQRLPAIPAVIALDLTFILRRSSTAVNSFLTIIFVGSDKETYRQNEQAGLNLKAVSSTLRSRSAPLLGNGKHVLIVSFYASTAVRAIFHSGKFTDFIIFL